MDVEEQIKVFREFIEQNYLPQLLEAVRKGQNYLVLDFSELIKFNTEITEEILESPEELLKAAELTIKEFDLPQKVTKFNVRLKNLPESQKIRISDIRSKHLNKFIWSEGIVRQKSDVRPHVTAAKFECPSCGNILNILQLDKKYKEPSRCGCGRKGKFKEVSKELVDGQGLVLEESPDDLDGSQPKRINVFLKDDLVSPFSERRTSPGSRVKLCGWVVEVPITLKSGGQATKYDLIIEANNIEPIEDDFTELNITEKEGEQIKEIAKSPNVISNLGKSIAPSIYGHDKIKEALALQLAGGCRKVRPDGVTTRGDIHILLIGDPGCIAGDSMVSLYYKGMKPIKTLGNKHLQSLRELVTKIRTGPKDLPYDYTSNFQIYKNQATLKLVTETGKSLICTYNQPLLTKKGWKRADELVLGEEIRVMPKIPHYIKAYKQTNFIDAKTKSNNLKKNIFFPKLVTTELAGLYGYIIGDGNIHNKGYRVTCYINEEEKDLLDKLEHFWKKDFNIKPKIYKQSKKRAKIIKDKENRIRTFTSFMPLYIMEINSKQIASNLSFLKQKRVPQVIFESPLEVISSFLKWLFEADGCTFSTGRGKTSIQLKAKDVLLLKDVQLLLLYYGIQSRIIEDNLSIRRSRDMEIFAQKIGFSSVKKITALAKTMAEISKKSYQQKRKSIQRYEKISLIEPHENISVYDFEVPKSKCFIANGIVCHNSGKSQILKRIFKVAPRSRFTSGKGASAAGLTASVVKDEFLGGWSLEAGTLVLANRGFAIIDEMDKMNKDDRSALHEALEQQSYHPETEIRLSDGSVDKIGRLVDEAMEKNAEEVITGKDCEILDYKLGLLTTDFTKIYPTNAGRISRHLAPDKFFEIEFQNGRKIKVTPEHPLFVYSSELKEVPADKIKSGDLCPGPRFFPTVEKEIKLETVSLSKYHKEIRFPEKIDLSLGKLIGYLVTEGHSYHQPSNHYAEIGVSNTNPEIVEEVKSLMKDIFKTKINVNIALAQNRKKATKDLTTIRCCSEPLYYFFNVNFKELLEKATIKRIPNLIKTSSIAIKTALLQSAFKGDGFIDSERFGYSTSSLGLAKDYQDLLMELRIYSYLAGSKQRGNMNAPAYKVVISGAESMESFVMKIATKNDPRLKRLKQLAERSRHKNNDWDIFPLETGKRLKNILTELRLDDGYFYNIIKSENNVHRKTLQDYIQKINKKMNKCETIISESDSSRKMRRECNLQVEELSKEFKVSEGTIYNLEKKKSDRLTAFIREKSGLKINRLKNEINQLNNLINSDLRFFKVKSVKEIKNKDVKWVYDLTVEPNKNFISEGLILHNSVSISKANIQATLRCETTVLAAANPKFGRFDPYGIVAEQIDLPPTLINRFDLIFPIKDLPNREKDEETATFILNLHKNPESAVSEIDTALLKKYFAYIRQKINPKMTDAAIEELKDYYITMRNSGTSEESGMKSIPITARQLEALVRLAEAAAKVRLAKTVTKKDAQKAIELIDYCLNQIAKDKDTGRIDIDRISSTVSASQRSGIGLLKEIISSLEEQMGTKMIPVDNIVEAAKEKNLSKEQVEDFFGKLKRSGDIFEPKRGFIQRL